MSHQGYLTAQELEPFASRGEDWRFCGTNEQGIKGTTMYSRRGKDNPLNQRIVHTINYDLNKILDALLTRWAQPFTTAGYQVTTNPTIYHSIGKEGRNLKVHDTNFGIEVLFFGNRLSMNRFTAAVLGAFKEDGLELLEDKIEDIKVKKNFKLFTLSVPAKKRTRTYRELPTGQPYQVITSDIYDPKIIALAREAFMNDKKMQLYCDGTVQPVKH